MDKGLTPAGLVALGVIVGLISTCVQSFGLTLQRKSHMIEDSKSEYEPRRAPYQRRRWQVGMFLFLVANIIGSSIQITTLPLPLLSTLQASGLVFNSVMASLILKEAWTWRTLAGTVLVAGGAVLISLFSALPEPSHNLEQLVKLFSRPSFLVWFLLSLAFVLLTLVADFTMRKIISARSAQSSRVHLVRGMGYGMLSGILSAHALLLAKSAVELIVRSIADKVNQFGSYQSWLIVLAFLVMALTQLYYLHLGLRLVSTSILYPFVFCIYNIVAVLDGLIYFRQTDQLPPLHAGLIGLGTFILLVGVLALSWRFQDEEETEDHHHGPHMAKAEIPQTVLAPGMGFMRDPDSESEFAETENGDVEDFPELDESQPLLRAGANTRSRSTRESRRVSIQTQHSRKRRRAATLKEVIAIWEGLSDRDENERYGSVHDGDDDTVVLDDDRPVTAGASRPAARADISDAADDDSDSQKTISRLPLQRAKTMPSSSSRGHRRRSAIGHQPQGALFSDLLRPWWRTRRKRDEEEQEANPRYHDV